MVSFKVRIWIATMVVSFVALLLQDGHCQETSSANTWLSFHELDGAIEFSLPAIPKKSLAFHGGGVEDVSRQYTCASPSRTNTAYLVFLEPLDAGNAQKPEQIEKHFEATLEKMKSVRGAKVLRHVVEGSGRDRVQVMDVAIEHATERRESRTYHRVCGGFAVTLSVVAPKVAIEDMAEAKQFMDSFRHVERKTGERRTSSTLPELMLQWAAIDATTIRYYNVATTAENLDRDLLVDFLKINRQMLDHRKKVAKEIQDMRSATMADIRIGFKAMEPDSDKRLIESAAKLVELFSQQVPELRQQFGMHLSEAGDVQKAYATQLKRLLEAAVVAESGKGDNLPK